VKVAVTMLVFCVGALLALGMVMLYSSSMAQSGAHDLVRQLMWGAVGLVLCVLAAMLDYQLLKKLAWPLFIVSVVLLVLVKVKGIGTWNHGAQRWFTFKGMSFQPSELGKLALLVLLAWYGERYQRHMATLKYGILIPGIFIGMAVGLIFIEPDVGNGLLLASVSGSVLLIAGIRLRYFLPPILIGITALSLFIYHDPMRSERIYSWLHLEETQHGKGLQAWQARVALGSGGITGKGLGDSRGKLGFLPFQQSDFIFAIIGEELGLVATLSVVVAFFLLLLSGMYVAWNAADTFGLLLGSGIALMIGLQAFINIGVVTGALPNKGLPLPFISQGGSNLAVLLTCVGLLLSIARKARSSGGLLADLRNHGKANPFAKRDRDPRPGVVGPACQS
jgi:cell division protein FtsW